MNRRTGLDAGHRDFGKTERASVRSIRRRQFLGCGLAAGFVGTAGCLTKQRPEATHWAAGIRWRDPPGEVFRELGFSPHDGDVLSSSNPKYYFRVNGGELRRTQLKDDSVPADRGDRVEFVVDFDTWRQGEETVFEYAIPDDEALVGVLAGFAECRHYRGTDEWTVRPLHVDLDVGSDGRPEETLVVQVEREYRDENPDWFVWGHTESIRETLRDRATDYYGYEVEVDLEFVDPDEATTFGPAAYHSVGMVIADEADWLAGVGFPEPDIEP